MLIDFDSVEAGASTVSAIIAAGIVPAALEMMDQLCLQAVEAYIHAGLPVDAAAALLVEVVGLPHGVAGRHRADHRASPSDHGVRTVRVAADEAERALLWKGRKSAFGAIARIKPNYYLHDTVVPRAQLPGGAGQGLRDRRPPRPAGAQRVPRRRRQPAPAAACSTGASPGVMERVHAAGDGDRAGVGGGRRGAQRRARHRAGEARPDAADVLRRRPRRPGRAARRRSTRAAWPTRARCCPARPAAATSQRRQGGGRRARGSDASFAEEVGATDPVTITGAGHAGRRGARRARRPPPAGIDWIQPAEMTVCVRRRHAGRRARRRAGGARPARWRSRRAGTVGGALAVGRSGIRRLGDGPVRDALLQARYVSAAGEVVKAGGPTVKNVSGFDLLPAARRVTRARSGSSAT